MTRIDDQKKQNIHFNFSFFDIFRRVDPTKSGKYIPVFSKVLTDDLNQRISSMKNYHKEISDKLFSLGFNISNLTTLELYFFNHFLDLVGESQISTIQEFIDYTERGLVDNKDVLTYKNMEDIRNAVSLASLKEYTKVLETQIHKEHDDDTWLIVRPLSFESSLKYGASTKWCTTYKREKEYFAKYFSRGALVYFINKKTGYKFAMYSEIYESENDISFWSAEDRRVDFFNLEVDTYLIPVIKSLANSKTKNCDFLSEEEKLKVWKDCGYHELKTKETLLAEVQYGDQLEDPIEDIIIDYDYPDVSTMSNVTITNNDESGGYFYFNNSSSLSPIPNICYGNGPEEERG